MTVLIDVLEERLGIDEETAVAWLEDALDSTATPGSSPLSSGELDYLAEHGGPGVAESLAGWDHEAAQEDRARLLFDSLGRIVSGSVTMAEAATRLGVTRSRISHRITDKTLWSVRLGARHYIPTWQFATHDQLLPGLTDVVRAIPHGASPEVVDALMHTPQQDLGGASPIAHLLSSGTPTAVCDLLADLDRW